MGRSFAREDVSTVGGLVLAVLGRVPRAGESFLLDGFRLTVDQVARRRIRRDGDAGGPGGGCRPARSRDHDLDCRAARPAADGVRRHHCSRLITSSRSQLAEVVARRLRGGKDSLAWLAPLERTLPPRRLPRRSALRCSAPSSPAFSPGDASRLLLLLVLFAIPAVLLSGYVSRLLTYRRAAKVAEHCRPILRPWAGCLPAFSPSPRVRPESLITELWRERARSGVAPDDELLRVGGVINFRSAPCAV